MSSMQSGNNAYRPLIILGSLVLVIGALYWAQKVLIPIATAFLLTFVLGPFVNLLQRARFGRVSAVLLVVFLTIGIIGGIATAITVEVNHLIAELPKHKENIVEKVSRLRQAGQGIFNAPAALIGGPAISR